ncbi:Spy/CpxP family protein refolding chaperone [Marinobacterium aestuariivivens]|uniref:Spy/CpxP family protein refolding chaperone n=1 Tax=Marinobacterium aestuariivivens TaxID=1698799 RepID=A0ABW2A6P9_9GAMM
MKIQALKTKTAGLALVLGAVVTAPAALAHGQYGMGGPMMGGGYGGHGMMGGYGMGMGPGMMGGYGMGMGPGMMEGFGSPGMALDLDKEQRQKMRDLQNEMHEKQWALMTRMHEEHNRLRELYSADELDPKAIGEQQQKLFDLHRQMTENRIETQNRMEQVLTPEQREKVQSFRHGGMMGW